MQSPDPNDQTVDHAQILDRIYEIALNPAQIDTFIDLWADKDFAAAFPQGARDKAGKFDALFKAHLDRAEAFLQLGDTPPEEPQNPLSPYVNFPAFVVTPDFVVEDVNANAAAQFGVSKGGAPSSLTVSTDLQAELLGAVKEVLRKPGYSERLIKSENETKQGAMLFRVIRLGAETGARPAALVVSTHIHWRDTVGDILNNAFDLTKAEQGVVRKLTEGFDVKSIAALRGTAVGTVREQVKSIIFKMNVRSQTDVVRIVLILNELSEPSQAAADKTPVGTIVSQEDWLQAQVFKPFQSIKLPDGRTMTYHDMGPSHCKPLLYSHMGSAMVRWSKSMLKLAFQHNLRIICPIRAGYGDSSNLDVQADVLDTTSQDTAFLLNSLGISHLPYAVHGTDFPFAADLVSKYPDLITEVIGIGARPCLPDGIHVEAPGRWQQFFVWTAQHNPKLVHFASKAVMMMSKRIGAEAMLNQLCKDSPADLALLLSEEIKPVLIANLELMAGPSSNAARTFAMEYIAFHEDWSDRMHAMRHVAIHIYIAEQDPTIDAAALNDLRGAYPWITFETIPNAGLALIYQEAKQLVPALADAAKRAALLAPPQTVGRTPVEA